MDNFKEIKEVAEVMEMTGDDLTLVLTEKMLEALNISYLRAKQAGQLGWHESVRYFKSEIQFINTLVDAVSKGDCITELFLYWEMFTKVYQRDVSWSEFWEELG